MIWWETTSHLKNAKSYNAQWTIFFRLNPNPTRLEILNEGRTIMKSNGMQASLFSSA